MSAAEVSPLLVVRDLAKRFPAGGSGRRAKRWVHALNGVSLNVAHGETLAVVGESGSGKTTLARAIALLHAVDTGWVSFAGQALSGLSGRALKPFRRRIQMVFQDPYASLNPRLTAAAIIAEPLRIHHMGDQAARRARVHEAARAVGLSVDDLGRYPHAFSGGQRQRIAIARALAPEPDLIIADEPLSALDVSVQSQVLNLLGELSRDANLAFLFITHDLAVVNHIADRVAVMYLGRVVETAPAPELFAHPRHPYTQALIDALPRPGRGKRGRGRALAGEMASAIDPPPGCAFHGRCPRAAEICQAERPRLAPSGAAGGLHFAACHFAEAP